MRWQEHQFDTAETLALAARECVRAGLHHRVRRDDSEPALAWLDDLGQARSDWLPAIGRALSDVALHEDNGAVAVADFVATARIAPALLGYVDALLEADIDGMSSVATVHHGGQGPMRMSRIRGPLAEIASGLTTPGWLFFDRTPSRAFDVGTMEKRRLAVLDSIEVGRQRTVSGFDPCALGWLRYLAFFAPELRAEVSLHLREACEADDSRGWFCAVEYFALARDMHWLVDLLSELDAQPPHWAELRVGKDEPKGWPRGGRQHGMDGLGFGPNPTLGAVIGHAKARAAQELSTAPRDLAH